MNIYSPPNIKKNIPISRYLNDQGYPIQKDRTKAQWRGGDGWNVHFDDEKLSWYDHAAKPGDKKTGSVLDLAMLIEGIADVWTATQILGERYNLVPQAITRKPRKKTKAELLTEAGWKHITTYTYHNEKGEDAYYVDRYEREKKDGGYEKTFLQRSPNADNIEGVERTIYNLPEVLKAERVFIVEGEKDVETLRSLGLVGTTNSSGGNYWEARFSQYFAGKDVIIMPDNDEVGKEHAKEIAGTLTDARTVRIVNISNIHKGDITDYITKEGGTLAGLMDKVESAQAADVDTPEVAAAKLANKLPLKNYTAVRTDTGKTERVPIGVNDMVRELKTRFLGFPRKLGSVLFDYTRHTNKIVNIQTKDALKAWVNGTSGQQSDFQNGGSFVQWAELFERLHQTVRTYTGISPVPWYPSRDDIFPTYPQLPVADPTHHHFWQFVSFFNPATDADKTLMAAFFLAPLYFPKYGNRPGWVIDTVDAQGSGKSSVVEMCAYLYLDGMVGINLDTIKNDITHIKKRVLSSDGRQKRFVFFDNVKQTVKSAELADFITCSSISGMAPYGRGEETRPNDLTWCITMNGAEMDTDIITRFYVPKIRENKNPIHGWKESVKRFADEHRFQIFADMMHMLANAVPRRRRRSRFPEFDAVVLSAACNSDEEFAAADAAICEAANEANTDADKGAEFIELLAAKIATADNHKEKRIDGTPIAISCTDVDRILRESKGALRNLTSRHIRNLVKQGAIPDIDRDVNKVTGGKRVMIYYPADAVNRNEPTVRYQLFSMGQSGYSNELSDGLYEVTPKRV